MNYDLKISGHLVMGEETSPAFPGKIGSLHVKIRDDEQGPQLPFKEICEFLG